MASCESPHRAIVKKKSQVQGAAGGLGLGVESMDSRLCASLLKWLSRDRGRRAMAQGVALLHFSFARDLFWAEHLSKSQYLARPGATRRILPKEAGSLDLVEGVLQIHGKEASFAIICRVYGAIIGWCGRWLHSRCWSRAPAVSAGGSVPCLRKQWPTGLSQCDVGVYATAAGRWPPSFFFKAVSEALAIQETTRPGMLPSAIIQTNVCTERVNSSL